MTLSNVEPSLRDEMLSCAREFMHGPVDYAFTEREQQALKPFFSNHDRRIFFMAGLPESVTVTLLAMYSRLKNPRGLRGHFVDHMVPLLMYSQSPEGIGNPVGQLPWKEIQKGFKAAGLDTLDKICERDRSFQVCFEWFLSAAANPEYWAKVADSPRIQDFKKEHLDKYGDKSIIRPARVLSCLEDVSIMLAKLVEDLLLDQGIIELSTRFVSFTGKTQYPIERELALIHPVIGRRAKESADCAFNEYRRLAGDNFDGPFPSFLREYWKDQVPADGFDSAIQGEACDVLGNLLPCTTLTQVGLGVSGEAFGEQLLKVLYLEGTPESIAVAEFLIAEARRCGYSYFVRRYEPSPWDRAGWEYLPPRPVDTFHAPSPQEVEQYLMESYGSAREAFPGYLAGLRELSRGTFDILPDRFRGISITHQGVMSYRGWRDVERQSMSIHRRSRVTPLLGFYQYPKPAPAELHETFQRVHHMNADLYRTMLVQRVPDGLMEYPMAMGNLVPYRITSDLKWAEFNGWQRTKWMVNDEVRQEFLKIEEHLRVRYPWWTQLSRADTTPRYVFARGKAPVVMP